MASTPERIHAEAAAEPAEPPPAAPDGPGTVIVVHNYYVHSGGEDQVVRAESALLSARGHTVVPFVRDNRDIGGMMAGRLAAMTLWNREVYRELRQLIRRHAPLAVHVHNTFPLVSPSVYYAARDEGVAVVQTLHNFRLVCPNGLLFRDGRPCESCVGKKVAWPAVVHACYHDSRPTTAAKVAMLTVHRARGTWSHVVDTYVALSEFSRDRFVEGGLPADRVVVKPNFLADDPGPGAHDGRFALFVGRLSREKGLRVLLDAWERLATDRAPALKVVGTGPARPQQSPPGVEWLGQQPTSRVLELMQRASVLVLPSECYENFPMTLAEAYATGLPVIASRIGSLAGLVRDGETGLQFESGNGADLAAKVAWAFDHPGELARLGARARRTYLEHFSADINYDLLMDIYRVAAERAARRAHARAMGVRR
jgi:glycosyltransferase involved in cell wall biosynthesis